MYSYKLNNSYTVYCYFPEYIYSNKKKHKAKASTKSYDKPVECTIKKKPLPAGTKVNHNKWGCGEVVSTKDNGSMTVSFAGFMKSFLYPSAFDQGFLTQMA